METNYYVESSLFITGILHDYYDPDEKDDWVIIDEPDHSHAKNGDKSVWIDLEIVEKEIQD